MAATGYRAMHDMIDLSIFRREEFMLVLDEYGSPLHISESLKQLTKRSLTWDQDSLNEVMETPNSTGALVEAIASSVSGECSVNFACGLNGSRHIVPTNWMFQKVNIGNKLVFVGTGYSAQDAVRDTNTIGQSITEAMLAEALVSVTDPEGRIIAVNGKFVRLVAAAKEEIIGKRHSEFFQDSHSKEFWRNMLRAIGAGQVWKDNIHVTVGTREYWLHSIINPIKGEDGAIQHIIHIQFDVTEYGKSLWQKQQLSEIAYIQSHDFRRPIANMLAIFDILNADPKMKKLPPNISLLLAMLFQAIKDTDEIIAKIVYKTVDMDDYNNQSD